MPIKYAIRDILDSLIVCYASAYQCDNVAPHQIITTEHYLIHGSTVTSTLAYIGSHLLLFMKERRF